MSNSQLVKKTEVFIEKFSDKKLQAFASQLAPELKTKQNYESYKSQLATLLISNPTLTSYDPKSLILATIQAYKEGLSFNPRDSEAYFIPYKDQIQFQKGYKAIEKELMRRHDVIDISVDIVCENDEFEVGKDSHGRLYLIRHVFNPLKPRGEMIGVYAFVIYRLKTGEIVQNGVALSAEEVEFYRSFSKSDKKMGEDSFWEKFKKDMWKKTAVHRLKNLLPAVDTPDYAVLLSRPHNRSSETSEYRKELNERFAKAFKNSGLTIEEGKKLLFTKYNVNGTDQLTDEQFLEFIEELETKGRAILDTNILVGHKEQKELDELFIEKQLDEDQRNQVYLYLGLDPTKIPSQEEYNLMKSFLQENSKEQILKTIGWKERKKNDQRSLEEALNEV